MTANHQHEKHFRNTRTSKSTLWARYDAQPASTREAFQQFPIDLWPGSFNDQAPLMSEAHARYLAGLREVWGPDHPAVIDAARRISVRGRKVVRLATADDL